MRTGARADTTGVMMPPTGGRRADSRGATMLSMGVTIGSRIDSTGVRMGARMDCTEARTLSTGVTMGARIDSTGARTLCTGVRIGARNDSTGVAKADESALSRGAITLSTPLTEADDKALSRGAMMLSTGIPVGVADRMLSIGATMLSIPLIEAEERMLSMGAIALERRSTEEEDTGVEDDIDRPICVGKPRPDGSKVDEEAKTLDKRLSMGAMMLSIPLIEAEERMLSIGATALERGSTDEDIEDEDIGVEDDSEDRPICVGNSSPNGSEVEDDERPICVGKPRPNGSEVDNEGVSCEPKPRDNMLPTELTGVKVVVTVCVGS